MLPPFPIDLPCDAHQCLLSGAEASFDAIPLSVRRIELHDDIVASTFAIVTRGATRTTTASYATAWSSIRRAQHQTCKCPAR